MTIVRKGDYLMLDAGEGNVISGHVTDIKINYAKSVDLKEKTTIEIEIDHGV